MNNPYFEEFSEIRINCGLIYNHERLFHKREALVHGYSWAIPDDKAINIIKKYGPVIEMGAGTGYWASLLEESNVDIKAYDYLPPVRNKNIFCNRIQYTNVRNGSYEVLSKCDKDRNLLLCWPPYNTDFASNCLKSFVGKIVIYIGEGKGGCTGNDKFHNILNEKFKIIESVDIPQWYGMNDFLSVWERL